LLFALQFTYGWLAVTYLDDARPRSRLARASMAVIDELPLWKVGAFSTLSFLQGIPGAAGVSFQLALHILAFSGAAIAWRRRRLLAWLVVFWGLGVGHQLERDCGNWWSLRTWTRQFRWQAGRLL